MEVSSSINDLNNIFGIYDAKDKRILTPTYNSLIEAQRDMELTVIESYKSALADVSHEIDMVKDKLDQLKCKKAVVKKQAPKKKAPVKKAPVKKNAKKEDSDSEPSSDTDSIVSDSFNAEYDNSQETKDDLEQSLIALERDFNHRYRLLEVAKNRFYIVAFALVK